VDKELARRIGRNEGLFRDVNEAIAKGLWPEDPGRVVSFRCECAQLDCNTPIRLTLSEYEHVRSCSRWFAVRAGHQLPGAEVVVETRPHYLIVEKKQEAGVVADALDPRN
jgi:hypothetical protein